LRRITIATVVGARPQFVKAAAVSRAIGAFNHEQQDVSIEESIIHTGQHYDENMSKVFFDQLEIPRPKLNLEIGSGSHGQQTGAMLSKLDEVFQKTQPSWVLVYGDTNSTLAAALAASKLHIPIAHVEAGLRSFNRRMPEEINRILTDQISKYLFCPTDASVSHLRNEGITRGVFQVGDVMRDALEFNLKLAEQNSSILEELKLNERGYCLVTVHRAENTNDPVTFERIVASIKQICEQGSTVVCPTHPRTRPLMEKLTGGTFPDSFRLIDPVSYIDMLCLEKNAKYILTDSGGVQKEASWVGVPCVTLRDETEWVETVETGDNYLAGTKKESILLGVNWAEKRGVVLPEVSSDPRASDQIVATLAIEGR